MFKSLSHVKRNAIFSRTVSEISLFTVVWRGKTTNLNSFLFHIWIASGIGLHYSTENLLEMEKNDQHWANIQFEISTKYELNSNNSSNSNTRKRRKKIVEIEAKHGTEERSSLPNINAENMCTRPRNAHGLTNEWNIVHIDGNPSYFGAVCYRCCHVKWFFVARLTVNSKLFRARTQTHHANTQNCVPCSCTPTHSKRVLNVFLQQLSSSTRSFHLIAYISGYFFFILSLPLINLLFVWFCLACCCRRTLYNAFALKNLCWKKKKQKKVWIWTTQTQIKIFVSCRKSNDYYMSEKCNTSINWDNPMVSFCSLFSSVSLKTRTRHSSSEFCVRMHCLLCNA